MEVTWVGGACFRLRGRDAAIAIDPQTSGIKQRSALPKADVVALSDPAVEPAEAAQAIRPNQADREPFVIDGPGEYEVAGVYVHGLAERRGANGETATLYAIDIDGLTVGHLARLTADPSDTLLDELGAIQILLINIDGGSQALPVERIIKAINRIEPNVVVPYGPRVAAADGQSWLSVARELSGSEPVPESSLSMTRANLSDAVTERVLEARHA